MCELSAITLFNPPDPLGCCTIDKVALLIAVTLYCSPSSKSDVEAVVENETMSPTLNALPKSVIIVKSPTATAASSTNVADISSKALPDGQVETNKLFPHVPADLAANVPTEPCPVE